MNKINLGMTILVSGLIGACIGAQITLKSLSPMAKELIIPYAIVTDHPDDFINAACKADENCIDTFMIDEVKQ